MTMKILRGFAPGEFKAAGASTLIFHPLFVLGTAVSLLQFYNLAVLNAFRAFFAAIVIQLMGAMLQFVRLILLPPDA
jgi:hypothetical protein